MISAVAAFFQLVVVHINRKGESDLHNNNDTHLFFSFAVFFFSIFFFSISKHPFILHWFSLLGSCDMWLGFVVVKSAAVEKKEPFEDASKKILLIVRKTESVHDLLKRWYLAKESEKVRRSTNGLSSEMGKTFLRTYITNLCTFLQFTKFRTKRFHSISPCSNLDECSNNKL